MKNRFESRGYIKLATFLLIALVPVKAFSTPPKIHTIEGEPEQGEVLKLDARAIYDLANLKVLFCNEPVFQRCTKSREQEITYRGGWKGPLEIRADFTGFGDGESVYVIPANYVEVEDTGDREWVYANPGEVMVYGHPLVADLEFSGKEAYEVTIMGNGFGSNRGSAAVYLTDNATWSASSMKIAQTIRSWTSTEVTFEVVLGDLSTEEEVFVFLQDDDGDLNLSGYSFHRVRPTVTEVTSENGIVQIQGGGFKDQGGEQILFDDFENGEPDIKITSVADTDWSGDWQGGASFSNLNPHSGSLSAFGKATAEDRDLFDTNYVNFEPSDQLFVSYMLAYRTNYPDEVYAVWKFSRMNSNDPGANEYDGPGDMGMGASETGWPNSAVTYYNNGNESGSPGRVAAFPGYDGIYSRVEMHKVLSEPGVSNGRVIFRIDDATAKDYTALTRGEGYSFQQTSSIMGIMLANVNHLDVEVFIDDYYVASTLARVIVSDHADYTATSNFAILPLKSWSEDLLEVELKGGNFDTLDGKFLTVIDRYGNMSRGYLLQEESAGNLTVKDPDSFEGTTRGATTSSGGCTSTSDGVFLALITMFCLVYFRRRLTSMH